MYKIFEGIDYEVLNQGNISEFTGIEYDSRKIIEGSIFAAIEGFKVDGHDFISKAIEKGAKLIIVSKDIEIENKDISIVKVENLRKNLGTIASNFYDWPQEKMEIIGITGTNGKTTTTYIIEAVLGKVARLGTIEYKIGDEIYEAPNTTPESLDVIKMCNKAVKKGIKYLIMEVSSHALELGRVDMLSFDSVLFTNLSQDHLDFHKTMDNYFNAKMKLFTKLKTSKRGVVNIDCDWGNKIIEHYPGILKFSMQNGDIIGEALEYTNKNMTIKLKYEEKEYIFTTKLMGRFNLYNIMGSFGVLVSLGLKPKEIIEKFKNLDVVPGRFETIDKDQNFMVVVDYAHTDDGLINILNALEEIKKGRIITIFGAGGDRDKTKRSRMAKAAAKFSDYIIVTSDNPRTEDPELILKDVEAGLIEVEFDKDKYIVIQSREEAIKKGINMAKENDIVLIAGKGHEDYQIIGTVKIHFDDREMARKYLDLLK